MSMLRVRCMYTTTCMHHSKLLRRVPSSQTTNAVVCSVNITKCITQTQFLLVLGHTVDAQYMVHLYMHDIGTHIYMQFVTRISTHISFICKSHASYC